MDNKKYTPGPWEVETDEDCFFLSEQFKDGQESAIINLFVSIGNPKAKANALLASCAPELLESLEALLFQVTKYVPADEYINWDVVAKAEEVIQKVLNNQ